MQRQRQRAAIVWLVLVMTPVSPSLNGCGQGDGTSQPADQGESDVDPCDQNPSDSQDEGAPDVVVEADDGDGSARATIEPHRETRGRFTIVWLRGTAYEMGYQHGELLHEELRTAMEYVADDPTLSLMEPFARLLGILDIAYENSYPDVIDECQGMVDAASDTGLTMDLCMALNFGDVLIEFVSHGVPRKPGCAGVAAAGNATPDGRLYHARNLDWDRIELLVDYPIIFVKQPSDGIPHAVIGFPANVTPYHGLNAAGLSVQSNEADPLDARYHDSVGRSHAQMLHQILKNCHDLDEAVDFIARQDHMTVEAFLIADGNQRKAAVFEMTATAVGIRQLSSDGIVYLTNHFVAEETGDLDEDPAGTSSLLRFTRLQQLVEPDGSDSLYGDLDPERLIRVLRDRVNPVTGIESPADTFNDDLSLATNGSLYQVIFEPERGLFWVAAGELPVPQQPYVGFSLGELLGRDDAYPVVPAQYP